MPILNVKIIIIFSAPHTLLLSSPVSYLLVRLQSLCPVLASLRVGKVKRNTNADNFFKLQMFRPWIVKADFTVVELRWALSLYQLYVASSIHSVLGKQDQPHPLHELILLPITMSGLPQDMSLVLMHLHQS